MSRVGNFFKKIGRGTIGLVKKGFGWIGRGVSGMAKGFGKMGEGAGDAIGGGLQGLGS